MPDAPPLDPLERTAEDDLPFLPRTGETAIPTLAIPSVNWIEQTKPISKLIEEHEIRYRAGAISKH